MKNTDPRKSIVVLVVICLVTSAALAVINHFTAPVIREAKLQRETASRQAVLAQAEIFEPLPSDHLPDTVFSAYRGLRDGQTVGYVFTAGRKGFNGIVEVICAIDPEGRIVNAATLDVSSETKTLGGQTANASYTDQYIGKDANLDGVDAISNATITSTAYASAIRDCFAAFDAVKEG